MNRKKYSWLNKFLVSFLFLAIAFAVYYFFWLPPRYVVPILMYHRFGNGNNNLFVASENLDRQMAYLKYAKYNVITLDELVEGLRNKKKFKKNTVVITIDDGYQDNFLYGFPIFKKYGFPITIFIVANCIGNDKEFLSWNEVQTMLKDNVSFGGHTKNHSYLPLIRDRDALWDEIVGCKDLIESKIGEPIKYFCYPSGAFTERIKEMVRNAGYKGACGTNKGFVKLDQDIYELKRIKITNLDTNMPFCFRAKLSGYYNYFRSLKIDEMDIN